MTIKSGVLLHLTSLPSDYGIGGLGKEAFNFIDFLKAHGQAYWQILPLNYPGYGDSPYNSISSFAGNPYLIDPEKLYQLGLVSQQDLQKAELPNEGKVDFKAVMKCKQQLFRIAFQSFIKNGRTSDLIDYLEIESEWLKPFTVFCHLKDKFQGLVWQQWDEQHRFYSEVLFDEINTNAPDNILYHVFLQYMFELQLSELKQYAVSNGIEIIGDLPLYVSLDSSDAWSRPDLFELDKDGNPLRVAGVPPDAFSETGQLWGNPLYRWDIIQNDNFDWWKKRLKKALVFADRLRLDHFIGYVNFWAIDAKEKSAVNGKWLPGPKIAFFDSMLQTYPQETIIAEDLGILTDEINNLRDSYGFPGMIILQFCWQDDKNDILCFPRDRIIYTGTHDNQTTNGWFSSNLKNKKPDIDYFQSYLHKVGFLDSNEKVTSQNASHYMMQLAYASPCHIAIVPMQDILGLDDSARMNIPGVALGNWQWRIAQAEVISGIRADWLKLLQSNNRIF